MNYIIYYVNRLSIIILLIGYYYFANTIYQIVTVLTILYYLKQSVTIRLLIALLNFANVTLINI